MRIKTNDKYMFFGYVVLFLMAIIFFIIAMFTRNDASVKELDVANFDKGWKTQNNEEANLADLTNIDYIYRTIEVDSDQILFYSVRNANTKLYIDDKLVEQDVVNNEFLYGKTRGTSINHVKITDEDNGKILKISFDKPTSKKAVVTGIYIGEGYDILTKIIPSKILPAGLSYAIVSIGMLLLISFITLKRKKLVGAEVLYLAIFSINLGLFLLLDNKLYPVLSGYEAAMHAFTEVFMMLLVIPLLLYLNRIYNVKNRKPLYAVAIMSFASSIISLTLNYLCIKDLSETVWLTQLTYIVTVFVFIYIAINNLKETKTKKTYHFIGLISLAIGCIIDILLIYLGTSLSTSVFTEIGVLVFLLFECLAIIHLQIEMYKENTKTEMLSKLAYQDGLTELLNRTSYVEAIEEIKTEKKDALICLFDVNNLKQVNDNIGHQAGDKLIITAAKTIDEAFKDYGKTYRIGGDEFVVLVTDKPTKNIFTKQIEVMNNILDEYNKNNNNPYIVSIAYGASLYKANGKKELAKVIEEADQNMYKKKEEIKSLKKHKNKK